MPLKLTIDSLDDVVEELRDEYEEQDDGSFKLKLPDGIGDGGENVDGLKSALRKERDANKEKDRRLKALETKLASIDVDEYEKLRSEHADAETQKLEAKGEFEQIKEQMRESHAKDMRAKDAEISRLRSELEREKIDSKVVEAISKANGNVELLKPHVRGRLHLDPDSLDMVVLDGDGKTPKVDGDGNPVTLDALVGEMRGQSTFAGAFKATEQSGSGSDPGKGGDGPSGGQGGKPNGMGAKSRSQMSDSDKVKYINEHGVDKFMALPD